MRKKPSVLANCLDRSHRLDRSCAAPARVGTAAVAIYPVILKYPDRQPCGTFILIVKLWAGRASSCRTSFGIKG